MTTPPPLDTADLFDEAGYLRLYPGLINALTTGAISSPWAHYLAHGRVEGRRPNDVDPEFYLSAYAAIERDLGRPPAPKDAAPHYIGLGRARGYLPNASAGRALNGAAQYSPFGGFWTDQANALDLIQARLDLKRMTARDAAMLRAFALEGIVELNRPSSQTRAEAAALMVEQAFTGMFPDLLFHGPDHAPEPWNPELVGEETALLDPHMMPGAIRDLLLDQSVIDVLTLIFDAPVHLTASRASLRWPVPPDRDAAWFAHSLPLQFVAITFSLEAGATGSETVWPGSHRLPDLPWSGTCVSLSEARRIGTGHPGISQRVDIVQSLLRNHEPRLIAATFGSRMIRHANLFHAAEAPVAPMHRRAVTAWYCPSYVVPGYVETTSVQTHWHQGVAFSSGVYPSSE